MNREEALKSCIDRVVRWPKMEPGELQHIVGEWMWVLDTEDNIILYTPLHDPITEAQWSEEKALLLGLSG